ncbi:MAG: helix-turn-helix domain-containing protein [Nitrospinales bacterium]
MQEKKYGAAELLGTRLRKWRKTLPLKSYQLARLIHISQGSLSDIENNKSLPSADTIAKLYQHTRLNIIWLLLNKGPMYRTERDVSATSQGGEGIVLEDMDGYGDDPKLRDLIEKLIRIYNKGDAEKKAHVVGFLNGADPGY